MTGLKDVYKSREENYLGKTGQIQMEVNVVNNQVQNAPVFYPAPNHTPNMPITLARECEDTLNLLGNCYGCNKPGHLKRNYPEGKVLKPKPGAGIIEDIGKKLIVSTVTRQDTMQDNVGDRRKTTNVTILRKTRGS